jgi:hypothetical protein
MDVNMNLDELVKLAAQIGAKEGAKAAMVQEERMRKKERAERRDMCFRNVKLLLENYRDFKAFAKNAIYSAVQAEEYVDISLLMWDPCNKAEQIVMTIKNSAITSNICLAHVDGMIHSYDIVTTNAKTPGDRRRYEVLYDRYISDEQTTVEELAEKYGVDVRTITRDTAAALNRVAKFFFGFNYIAGESTSDEDSSEK